MENKFEKLERRGWIWNRATAAMAGASVFLGGLYALENRENQVLEYEKKSLERSVEELEDDLDRNRTSYRTIAGTLLIDGGEYGDLRCSGATVRYQVYDAEDLVTCVDRGGAVQKRKPRYPWEKE